MREAGGEGRARRGHLQRWDQCQKKGNAQWQRTLVLCKTCGWTPSYNAGSSPCEKGRMREAGGEAGARVSHPANASGNSACEKSE
eukprot:2846139-Pyramimonas_sp.AAC.1